MPEKHLPIGGSTVARALQCPGSVNLVKTLPKSPPADPHAPLTPAMLGTLKHEVMQLMADKNIPVENIAATDLPSYTGDREDLPFDMDDFEDLQVAYSELICLINEYNIYTVLYEPFVQLVEDEIGGSIDVFGVSRDKKTLVIIDYKFGFNKVSNHLQLLFYALCADADPVTNKYTATVNRVVTAIIQPSNALRSVTITDIQEHNFEKLDDLENKLLKLKKDIAQDPPVYHTGPECRWCPALDICPKKTGTALRAVKMTDLQIADLAEAMKLVTELEPWIKAVKSRTHAQLELGAEVPGWKLVAKRAVKKWTDLDGLMKFIHKSRKIKTATVVVETPLTPTQMIKEFKAQDIDTEKLKPYYSDSSSGTTLAPEDDKRPAAPATKALAMMN